MFPQRVWDLGETLLPFCWCTYMKNNELQAVTIVALSELRALTMLTTCARL